MHPPECDLWDRPTDGQTRDGQGWLLRTRLLKRGSKIKTIAKNIVLCDSHKKTNSKKRHSTPTGKRLEKQSIIYKTWDVKVKSGVTKQSILWTPGYTFYEIKMKWKPRKIGLKSTRSSLIRTYFLIYLLISRCENLKMLPKIYSHGALLSFWIQWYISQEKLLSIA